MEASEILYYARNTLDDWIQPFKWTNADLVLYLNDAQDEVARRTHCIVNYPSEITITGSSNISFVASTKRINKPSGGFLSAGTYSEAATFEKDDTITVTGTTSNNSTFTILSVTDTSILVSETLVDESNTSAVIEDTRNVTRIPIDATKHTYKLHPKTLMVLRAKIGSLTYPLSQKSVSALDAEMKVSYSDIDSTWYYESWETDNDVSWAFIEDNGTIRIVSPPSAADVLWMIVSRLPKLVFTEANLGLSPEIATQYHQDMVDWIAHRAYLKQDTEAYDMTKAKYWEDSFDKKFGPRPTAQTEQNRKKFPPNQRMRVREFGFSG